VIGSLVRLFAILIALALCAGAALVVYTSLDRGLSLTGLAPSNWDAPVSEQPERVVFTVQGGQPASAVGDALQARGLIRSAWIFRWEVESQGLGNKLEAGDYELSPSMSTREIVAVLARGAVKRGTTMTNLEGWRADQVAKRLEELNLARADQILQLVRSPRDHGLSPPDSTSRTLEGYLFPETYEFDAKATPEQIVETMVRQFDRRFDQQLRAQAAGRGLSVSQAVVLASIIEREAQNPAERPLISAVYHNRLAQGMKLEADPTVQYAVADADLGQAARYGFWKPELSVQELKIESPYNTYQRTGLPPAPICSPGLAALEAAVAPADVPYLFFVARGDGSHAFAVTLSEHNANISRFR
jgi:UPF0755 protein